jgi:small subunit ribosomal protein S7
LLKKKLSVFRKDLVEDPIYGSYSLQKFINCFVKNGRKEKIYNIFLKIFSHELHKNYTSYFLFFESLEKFKPVVKIFLYKFRKEVYKLPGIISLDKRYHLAIKYYYNFMKSEEFEKTFHFRLRNQFLFIFFTESLKVPELELIKKNSIENRMFIHYR